VRKNDVSRRLKRGEEGERMRYRYIKEGEKTGKEHLL